MTDAPVGDGRDSGTATDVEDSPTASSPPRIPVSEVPELEPEDGAETEPDADEDDAGDADEAEDPALAETTVVAPRKPDPAEVDEPEERSQDRGESPAEAGDDDETRLEEESEPPAAEPAQTAEAEAEARRVALAEVEETTLIPKVAEAKPVETTTVMPAVAPESDMARRPYSDATAAGTSPAARRAYRAPSAEQHRQAPKGYAREAAAAPAWTAAPTPIPAPATDPAEATQAARKARYSYRPPEFHTVDPQRDELPPPHNFQLDQREVDGDDRRPRSMVRRVLLVTGGLAVAAAAGLTAAGKIKVPGTTPAIPTVGFSPAAETGASSSTQTGTAFLTAWQNEQFEAAANITDDPGAALAALQEYKKVLGVSGMVVNPNPANSVGWMTYSITTQAGTPMGEWQYAGGFATYSKQIDGYTRWFVKWDPAILYTSLKTGYKLAIRKTPASIKGLVDRNGKTIDATAHPSLAGIILLVTKSAEASGGTAGQDIIMTDAKGKQLATVTTLTKPIDNGTVATTLDLDVQTAAEAAVTKHADSSVVAIQPSTGHILAIANHTTSQYYDDALLAGVAPGSTFKIITSAALLSKGLTTLDSSAPCPATITIDTTVLHNSEGEAGDYTYKTDFATSCNNAFSSFWNHSGMTGNLLADTALKYFGLNQAWDIGLGQKATYMDIPKNLTRGDLAESLVGQGKVVSCPLAMCSVAATVANGSFKQPILLPGQKQLTATPLGSGLQGNLKTLMASVISSGTAASVGFPNNGHFYGKTGTAEVGSPPNVYNNSWFVVFNDQHDLAVCALSIKGGYGASVGAPECLKVFQKMGYA
ncbi:penicillin-binding transpeptidase domain-containing protein [Actinospica robiniae]|uniref:penicillin-binding transpeptidase domain-containing protein n=1 Tax=Actinospica robiniae TaxID=304901 RepID=UPI0004200360|nr:penicillin-binding transpeptidase domain-containing protein [Actinospica robiniae]